jgi:nucleoid DNA-binding protein
MLLTQKKKARKGFNPKAQQKIEIPAKTVACCQGGNGRGFGGK